MFGPMVGCIYSLICERVKREREHDVTTLYMYMTGQSPTDFSDDKYNIEIHSLSLSSLGYYGPLETLVCWLVLFSPFRISSVFR